MAEGIMKKMIKNNNINAEVYSCGVYAETGEYATYNAVETVKEYNVDISHHSATNIRESNIEKMDLILCATQSHKQSVLYLNPSLKGQVYTMKEYAKLDKEGQDLDIKDPWGYNENVYKNCAIEIKQCLEKVVERLK